LLLLQPATSVLYCCSNSPSQTAALLRQLQLQATFNFSQEEQQMHMARAFGCAAPAASTAALPHGSSRVAAFLASGHESAAVGAAEAAKQQQLHVVTAAAAAAGMGELSAISAAAASNPDEICLE
jgi:porphobilinogen deaminase